MIDEHARSRLIRRYGESVNEWITTLPVVIDTLAARWDLTVVEHLPGGTGAAFRCTTTTTTTTGAGADVVLKLSPDHDLTAREAQALTAWAGTGAAVALLDIALDRVHEWITAHDPFFR